MHCSSRGSRLVFAALNGIQSNLCMASNKDKDKKCKAEDKKLAAETAAKKKKDDEAAAALVASTFMEPGSAAPSEASEKESVDEVASVDARASPVPSTGTGEVEEAPQHTTQSKDSDLPEYLKFDVLEPSPKANNVSKLHHKRAKAVHLEEQLVKLHKQLHNQQHQ
eukprot:3766578-Rhodomonas_salina.1